MNYKLAHRPGELIDMPGTAGSYVSASYDIIETTTDQIVIAGVPNYIGQAKALCRHLNNGGGFNGFTPAFLLQTIT